MENNSDKRNILENKIAIISLILSVISLFISYRSIQLEEVDHRPHFVCITKNNEKYEKPENYFFKIHTVKNIGNPISNVEILAIQEVLCFQRTLTGEDMEVLLWKEEYTGEKDSYEYDLEKQEFVIEGTRLEYTNYMLNNYFNNNVLFYEPREVKAYDVTCKRILEIRYTDAEGVICNDCYEIKENYICNLKYTPQLKDYDPNVIYGFVPSCGYDAVEAYQYGMEEAEEMITNKLGINIEEEKEELAKQYDGKRSSTDYESRREEENNL